MKKHLALLLVAVLSLTALLGLAPIASAAETVTTSQEIAYMNVSISTNVELLFAVPADGYDTSKETVPVQLLVWEGTSSSGLYNYADENVVKLQAAGTLDIGGKKHIIFTYNGLSAAEMSTVVYARVMSTDSKGLRNYGDVYDYSIAEFANGYLNKQKPAQEELVKAMMDYGYCAAIYYDKTSYTVDEVMSLKKVTVTAKLDGKTLFTQTTQLAPKDTEVTLAAPHVDGATFTSWEGDGITDGKITLSDDVNLVANYTKKQVLSWNYDSDTVGAIKDNFNHSDTSFVFGGDKYTIKSGSEGYYTIGSTKDNQRVPHEYAGYTVVADPNNPQNKCLKITHTGAGELKVGPGWNGTGIGDTVESVTFSFDITASPSGKLPATILRIDRLSPQKSNSLTVCSLSANGNISINGDESTLIAKASPDKATKITIVLNFAENSIDAYADGEYIVSQKNVMTKALADLYLQALDAGTNTRFRFSLYGGYLGANLATVPAELVEAGIFTFAETDTAVVIGGISQCYKKNSNGSYTYLGEKVAKAEEALAAGTTIYTASATDVDYDELLKWLDANSTCYIDNLELTYGDAMGK